MSGRIIISDGVNIWPHELETARTLARYGHVVEFKKKTERYRVSSADVYMDNTMWEFKAPKGNKIDAIERNLRRAKNQSSYIVLDSIRMKKIPDSAIAREIVAKAPHIKGIYKIIFINRRRECIDIYKKMR